MKDRDHDYDKDKTLGLAQGLRLVLTSCHYSCGFMLIFIIVVITTECIEGRKGHIKTLVGQPAN